MVEVGNSYKILVGEPEDRRIFQNLVLRWENNIKLDLKEIGCEDMIRIGYSGWFL
jgi:hypothetical protein